MPSHRGSQYTEDALVEQPAIALFGELGWQTVNAFQETFGDNGTLGRENRAEVVLVARLRPALERLNPDLPAEAINAALEEITRDRSALLPVRANRAVYELLRDGVKVPHRDPETGDDVTVTVRVIDWQNPAANDFLLVSQLWLTGPVYTRRADLVGFVNGVPLVFLELKASHRSLRHAYDDNLRDYKDTIPQLFWYNALLLLSNGGQSKIGSVSAAWEHFTDWKKINHEGEKGVVSLETMIRGTCAPERLLDLVENFILFSNEPGGLVKLVAKNHQYLGVNNAVRAAQRIRENKGRLGVFWHTQGSGKSYSMVFFAQKVLRKLAGNWTFLIVTDRQELDQQIYQTFARAGAVSENEESVCALSGAHLKDLLREDHRYLFTLIQKFRNHPPSAPYPPLSDRADIIVITDEAHRSQYDLFAQNLRTALPRAGFLGFTGTPLIAGEEKTRREFGDYVSVYNFQQSIADGATVPLFYENRIPELELVNDDLNDDLYEVLDNAQLDEAEERKLDQELGKEYHLLIRDDRLERIALDIVTHFLGRGFAGKAMVVSVDKATAARMHEKVGKQWGARLADLRRQLPLAPLHEQAEIEAQIKFMAETDRALVVSQNQNEVADMKRWGIDMVPHRLRMQKEDLADKFKNPDDPLRLVFVCAMWMTGFDVPSCSTVYLDKPMRNHSLMQTIARANRVFAGKTNGLIVDYVGVFRNLQKALALYGTLGDDGSSPVASKETLAGALATAIGEATAFCAARGVDTDAMEKSDGFARVALLDAAVDKLVATDEVRRKYLGLAATVDTLLAGLLPHPGANQFLPARAVFHVLAQKIRALDEDTDIAGVLGGIAPVLDLSIASNGYVIRERPDKDRLFDLSRIDFEGLRKKFDHGHKHTQALRLQAALKGELKHLVALNHTRTDYLVRFEEMIADYNAGSANVDEFYQQLLDFTASLGTEAARTLSEGLSEEELAVFDLLTKPRVALADAEVKQIKEVARDVLATLKREKLVLEWRKRQTTRAAVKLCVEEYLDKLPAAFNPDLYRSKCDQVYQHVYDSYYGQGQSLYQQP